MANDEAAAAISMPDAGVAALLADLERVRAELARQLHGELGGALAAARMSLSALRQGAAPDAGALAQVDAQLASAQALKQQLVERLRPGLLDHFGVGVALASRCETACREAGVPLASTVADDLPFLAPESSILLYRLGDAAVSAMLRVKPRSLRLALSRDDVGVLLRISHEGRPANLAEDPLMVGMGVWLAHLGGTLTIERQAGRGGLSALLPCP